MKETYLTLLFLNGGFFGAGDEIEFKNFSLAYFLPIIITILAILLIKKYADKLSKLNDFNFRVYYSISTILIGVSYYWRLILVGPTNTFDDATFLVSLPFQVCEITLLIASIAMINKSDKLFNISFFLVNVASIPPFIIPETVLFNCGPTRFRYYQYYLMHMLPIISTYYLMFVHKMEVKYKGVLYTLITLSLLYAFDWYLNSILINLGFDPLYMYMNLVFSLNLPPFFKTFFGLFILLATLYVFLSSIVYLIYKKVKDYEKTE